MRPGGHPTGVWELGFSNWALVELIEAAVHSGAYETAADAYVRLAEMTRASGTNWALGIDARTHALLAEGDEIEPLFPRSDRASQPHPRSGPSSPVRISSTVSGFAARTVAWTPAYNCGPRTRC